jgi:hypothetical protein
MFAFTASLHDMRPTEDCRPLPAKNGSHEKEDDREHQDERNIGQRGTDQV